MQIPTRQQLIDLARAELMLGVREDVAEDVDSRGHIIRYWGAVNDPRSAKNREDVESGKRGWAWCGAFVSYLYEVTGYPMGSGFAYVPYLQQWLEEQGYWQEAVYEPDPGDLIVFKNSERVNHVGIVEKVEGDIIHTIEGNLSDGLRRRKVKANNPTIAGYGVVLHE